MPVRIPFALLATALACSLFTAPAQARARVFVASYGSDSNACTFGSPCKTFQRAVNVVDPGGEVTAIDSAGFGTVTIDKSVTLTSPPGVEASIATSTNQSAITVAAGVRDVVTVRGLTLIAGGDGGGEFGVNFTSGYKLAVINCLIAGYTQYGISINVTAATAMLISNTVISDMPVGVFLQTNGNSGGITAAVDHSTFDNNTTGIEMLSEGGLTMAVIISNSEISANATSGVGIYAFADAFNNDSLTLRNVTFSDAAQTMHLEGTNAFLSQVTQPRDLAAFVFCDGPAANSLYSDGTNHLNYGSCGAVLNSWTSN
jgi:hypothetical protein